MAIAVKILAHDPTSNSVVLGSTTAPVVTSLGANSCIRRPRTDVPGVEGRVRRRGVRSRAARGIEDA